MTQTPIGGASEWVLVLGTLCTDRVFDPLMEELAVDKSACQVIATDAPDVRDYDARLREAVTEGKIVCGFSLGALILAHNLGALKPARAVVLLAANPFPDPPGNRVNRESMRDRVLEGGARDWVRENWAAMSSSKCDDIQNLVASMAEETIDLIVAQTELAASRPGAADDLASTGLPLIFITGSEDRLTPAGPLAPIVENAMAAHLSVLQGLGHFALIEAAHRVAEAIRQGCDALGLDLNGRGKPNETREHSGVAS